MASKRKESTIKDVAKAAKCSIGSVSRVINGYDVSPNLKKRIDDSIRKLGYISPAGASAPRKRTGDVLILIHDRLSAESSWTQMVLFHLMKALGNFGYRAIVEFRTGTDGTPSEAMKMVDACIVWGDFNTAIYDFLSNQRNGIPIVSYTFKPPYENSICLMSDKKEDMHNLVLRLRGYGHTKIGVVLYHGGKDSERCAYFKEAIDAYACELLPGWLREDSEKAIHPGYAPTLKILEMSERPSAIVYLGDLMAFGGIEAVKSKGMRIPEDISVIGYDDIPMCSITIPPLSTMRLDTEALAILMVESMEKLLLSREHQKVVFFKRDFINRESLALKGSVQ